MVSNVLEQKTLYILFPEKSRQKNLKYICRNMEYEEKDCLPNGEENYVQQSSNLFNIIMINTNEDRLKRSISQALETNKVKIILILSSSK